MILRSVTAVVLRHVNSKHNLRVTFFAVVIHISHLGMSGSSISLYLKRRLSKFIGVMKSDRKI